MTTKASGAISYSKRIIVASALTCCFTVIGKEIQSRAFLFTPLQTVRSKIEIKEQTVHCVSQ